jgi:hypothetical protein
MKVPVVRRRGGWAKVADPWREQLPQDASHPTLAVQPTEEDAHDRNSTGDRRKERLDATVQCCDQRQAPTPG